MAIGDDQHGGHVERRRRTPETLRLRAVMPMLLVSNLERSLEWYTNVLGFVVAEELRRDGALVAVQLKAGKVQFLLEQDPDRRPDRPRGHSIRIYCATRQDVNKLAATIEAQGGVIQQAPDAAHGGRDFSLLDPDGYAISIFWRPD